MSEEQLCNSRNRAKVMECLLSCATYPQERETLIQQMDGALLVRFVVEAHRRGLYEVRQLATDRLETILRQPPTAARRLLGIAKRGCEAAVSTVVSEPCRRRGLGSRDPPYDRLPVRIST